MAANKDGMSPVAAGVVGAVVGAAVGATAVVLSEEKNRKALGKEFTKVKEEVEKVASGVGSQVQDVASQGEKKVEAVKKDLKK
jgi:gas vesicle protein